MLKTCSLALRSCLLRVEGLRFSQPRQLGRNLRVRRGWTDGHPGMLSSGTSLWLEDGVLLDAWGGVIKLGTNVFLGPYVVIYGHGGVEIGDDTLVSMHCRILSSNHTVPPPGVPICSQPDILLPTKIGQDVWLGAGVTVLGGVTIGNGCVVGAGAVVTHDLPPNSIALGVPARVISTRS